MSLNVPPLFRDHAAIRICVQSLNESLTLIKCGGKQETSVDWNQVRAGQLMAVRLKVKLPGSIFHRSAVIRYSVELAIASMSLTSGHDGFRAMGMSCDDK